MSFALPTSLQRWSARAAAPRTEAERAGDRLAVANFINLGLIGGFALTLASTLLLQRGQLRVMHYAVVFELYLLVFWLWGLFVLPHPPRSYGLLLANWRRELAVGLPLAAAVLGLAAAIRFYLVRQGLAEYEFTFHFNAGFYIYPLFVPVQELVSKGYLQSYFVDLFGRSRSGRLKAVLAASFVFGLFHLPLGFAAFLVTFVYALFSGALYERSRSIVGISLIHLAGGIVMFQGSPVL